MGNSEQCVEFYYYHEPSIVGSLNIYAVYSTQNYSAIGFPLWTEPFVDNGVGGWQIAQVPIGYNIASKPYQILFEEYVEANKPGK